MKLNVGCGAAKRKEGYAGIDLVRSNAVDVIATAWALPYKSDSVKEVRAEHLVEHLFAPDYEKALAEWMRVLESGGKLVLRCPNFVVYVRDWLEGDEDYRSGDGLLNIYGYQDQGEGLLTRTGFTRKRLRSSVKEAGFSNVACRVMANRSGTKQNGDLICVAVA